MTLCNLSIEGGARAGLVAPDEKTFAYMKGRPAAPKAGAWEMAEKYWSTLFSDDDAHWDEVVEIDAKDVEPTITWGTSPEQAIALSGNVPDPAEISDQVKKSAIERALPELDLRPIEIESSQYQPSTSWNHASVVIPVRWEANFPRTHFQRRPVLQ